MSLLLRTYRINCVLLLASCWILLTDGFSFSSSSISVGFGKTESVISSPRPPPLLSSRKGKYVEVYDDLEFISDEIEDTPVGMLDFGTLNEIPLIVQAWLRREEPTRIDRLLQRVLDEKNCGNSDAKIDRYTYNLALTSWANAGFAERAEALLRKMIEDGVRPNRVSFNICMKAWTKSRTKQSGERATLLFSLMNDLGVIPDLTTYNSLLDALAKASRYGDKNASQQAESILDEMIKSYIDDSSDVLPDNISFTCVLEALTHTGNYAAAEKSEALVKKMILLSGEYNDPDIFPDTVTFTTLINAWGKSGEKNSGSRALSILHQMEQWFDNGYEAAKPNLVSFNAVLNAFAKQGDTSKSGYEAEELFQYMRKLHSAGKYGLEHPNYISIYAMIEAWAVTKSRVAATKAWEWLRKLETVSTNPPNVYTYAKVIDAWSRNRQPDSLKNALDVFVSMEDKYRAGEVSLRPITIVYNAMIDAYANSNDAERAEKAEELLRKMCLQSKNGFHKAKPNVYSYTSVINAWFKSQHPDAVFRANNIFNQFMQEYTSWDHRSKRAVGPHIFLLLMKMWARSNHPEKSTKVYAIHMQMCRLHEEGNANLKPNASSFTIIINACAFSADVYKSKNEKASILQIAVDTMEELRQSPYANPTDITYGTFMKACYRLLGASDKVQLNALLRSTYADALGNNQLTPFVLKQLRQASSELYDELLNERY